jgi:predicted nucleic acid-binding protein
MFPSSNLIVYYYQANGEIVLNQVQLSLNDNNKNFVRTLIVSYQIITDSTAPLESSTVKIDSK